MRLPVLAALFTLVCLVVPLTADTLSIRGRIVDPSGLPLPGVTVTLQRADGETLSTTTGSDGEYAIATVPPGRYDIEALLEAFGTAVRHDVDVSAESVTIDLALTLAEVREDVTVSAPSTTDVLGSTGPDAPVSVTRSVMDIAMFPNSQFDDALALMPNVVRGPDGLIAVAGARAASGALFVNLWNASDPIVGGPGVMLPLEAVDTMQVYAGGAPAAFGLASGGVTAVQTRAGTDRFHMDLDSFLPRLLYTDSGVGGVAFWDPNLGFSGPIVKGRVTYQQAVSARYDRNSFTTLAGPDHNLFTALLSWTQVDATLSPAQRLRVSISADPRQTDRANITAFTPAATSPRVNQGGWSAGASDAIVARGLLVDLRSSIMRTRAAVTPQGNAPYVMTHELVEGNYFDRQDRMATRVETGGRLTWSPTPRQVVSLGVSLEHSVLDQTVAGAGITMLRSDGTVARNVAFGPAVPARVQSTAVGLFAEDAWSARSWLTLDVGVRYDATTAADEPPLSPRVGWTIGHDGARTTISGSAGLFANAMPLGALAFATLPARVFTFEPGIVPSPAGVSPNTVDPLLHVPEAVRWDLEVNRRVGIWLVRARYEERHGRRELVVEPSPSTAARLLTTDGAATLTSHGASRARSLETTAGFRSSSGREWYLSYVRAATLGQQNRLEAVEGLARVPFLQADLSGPLSADVPHRILAWGVFHLPGRLTIAPFLDTRSGFPFTAIDDNWVMVGTPNARRLPWTTSLDLSATTIVGLTRHLPEARVGIKLYNIVSANTERDVQRDVARADFWARYDPVPRDFSFVFEFLWGRHDHR